MRILSIELKEFKPMQHCGVHRFRAEFVSPITVIVGANGCGKSRLLNELTPLPPIRTDYDKDGHKVVVVEHESKVYTLYSDFTQTKSPHSFLCDGKELNPSGNTEIQRELCQTIFNYTPLSDDVTSIRLRMCDMTRIARRELLYQTYPQNLTFILEHHKRVKSQTLAFRNNVKMLETRKVELGDAMVRPEQFRQMEDQYKQLSELTTLADKIMLLLRDHLDRLEEQRCKQPYTIKTPDKLINDGRELVRRLDEVPEYPGLTTPVEQLTGHVDRITKELDRTTELAEELQQEIAKYSAYGDSDGSSKERLELTIKSLIEHIEKYRIDGTVPSLDEETLDRLHIHTIPKLRVFGLTLQGLDRHIYRVLTLSSIGYRKSLLAQQIATIEADLNSLRNRVTDLDDRLDRERLTTSPIDCKRECVLRIDKQKILDDLTLQRTILLKQITELDTSSIGLRKKVAMIEDKVSPVLAIKDQLAGLEEVVERPIWKDYIVGDEYLSIVNQRPMDIVNRFTTMVNVNRERIQRQQAIHDLELARIKLKTIEASTAPSKELIEQTLKTQSERYQRLTEERELMLKQRAQIKHTYELTKRYGVFKTQAKHLEEDLERSIALASLARSIEFHQNLYDAYAGQRQLMMNEMVELESSLRNQRSLKTRLDEEVIPVLQRTYDQYKLWTAVEQALSPTDGIPYLRLTHHTNAMLSMVNEILSHTWSYDMQLNHLVEGDPLTFDLSLTINNNTPLRDIGMCSDGQKAIVDLAWVLAVYGVSPQCRHQPLRLDEIDAALSETHRVNLLELLSSLVTEGKIEQMFIVNHHASLSSSFLNGDTICLNESGIVLPSKYNEHAVING